jgi:hypothetical protein
MDPTDTVEYLRSAAEYGPKNPQVARGLRGWRTPADNYVCGACAGRILGRGCSIPRDSEPIWHGQGPAPADCCVCGAAI